MRHPLYLTTTFRETVAVNSAARTTAIAIVRCLQDAGFAAFFVGGCVRDTLLGRAPGDFDIATTALPAGP